MVSLVGLTLRKDCPRCSSHLAGNGHCGDVGRSSLLDRALPWSRCLGMTQHRSGAVDEERTQVGIPSLRYGSQSNLASSAALARHKSQERSKLAAGLERRGITHGRYQRRCGETTDAWHVGDRAAGSVLLLAGAYTVLELIDLRLQPFDALKLVL